MTETRTEATAQNERERVPLILEPCDKAHDAEQDRYTDEDGACDDGVN